MKKLNKHPRLFKRIANTLKKLITNKIRMVRNKMINNKTSNIKGNNSITTNNNNNCINSYTGRNNIGNNIQYKLNKPSLYSTDSSDFGRIINVTSFRSIPYDNFILRITPYDQDTYLKMIEANLSSRLEITVNNTKPIKYVIDVLTDKWRNVQKKHPKNILYLIPIEEIWIPQELTLFSPIDGGKAYDIGDIYTAYGSPSTNVLYMKYQWSDNKKEQLKQEETSLISNNAKNMLGDNNVNTSLLGRSDVNLCNSIIYDMNSNKAIKNDNSSEDEFSEDDNIENECDKEGEKSLLPLESELNIFDPLEFMGIEDEHEKRNSTDEDDGYNNIYEDDDDMLESFCNNKSARNSKIKTTNNDIASCLKTPSTKRTKMYQTKRIPFVNNVQNSKHKFLKTAMNNSNSNNNNNNRNSLNVSNNNCFSGSNHNNNNNNPEKSNSKLRTGYSEIFSQKSECGLMLTTSNHITNNNNNNNNSGSNLTQAISYNNLNQISSHIKTIPSSTTTANKAVVQKRKIPFVNNVNKEESDELKHKHNNEMKFEIENNNNNNKCFINPIQETSQFNYDKINEYSPLTNKLASPLKKTNKNSMLFFNQQQSNQYMSTFQQETMNGIPQGYNNINSRLYGGDGISNFIPQNSVHFNTIFDHGNNTNIDFYRNTSNIFKTEYCNTNLKTNNNLSQHIGNTVSNIIKDDNTNMINNNNNCNVSTCNNKDVASPQKKGTSTRKRRNKEKKGKDKEKKNTLDDNEDNKKYNNKIKEQQQQQQLQQVNNAYTNQNQMYQGYSNYNNSSSNNNISNPYILNQNHYFTGYPTQFYPQLPLHLDIPLPSKFMEDKNSNYNYFVNKINNNIV